LQKELQDVAQHILIKYVASDASSKTSSHHTSNSKAQQLQQQSSLKADSQNSIWKSLVSAFNRSPSSQHSSPLGKESPVDGLAAVDDNDLLCGLGYSRSSTPASKDASPKYTDFDGGSETYLADGAVLVSSYDGKCSVIAGLNLKLLLDFFLHHLTVFVKGHTSSQSFGFFQYSGILTIKLGPTGTDIISKMIFVFWGRRTRVDQYAISLNVQY